MSVRQKLHSHSSIDAEYLDRRPFSIPLPVLESHLPPEAIGRARPEELGQGSAPTPEERFRRSYGLQNEFERLRHGVPPGLEVASPSFMETKTKLSAFDDLAEPVRSLAKEVFDALIADGWEEGAARHQAHHFAVHWQVETVHACTDGCELDALPSRSHPGRRTVNTQLQEGSALGLPRRPLGREGRRGGVPIPADRHANLDNSSDRQSSTGDRDSTFGR